MLCYGHLHTYKIHRKVEFSLIFTILPCFTMAVLWHPRANIPPQSHWGPCVYFQSTPALFWHSTLPDFARCPCARHCSPNALGTQTLLRGVLLGGLILRLRHLYSPRYFAIYLAK